ncbi:hypothetical protein BH11ACT4_BH11ACT4_02650 [soil metagenome]
MEADRRQPGPGDDLSNRSPSRSGCDGLPSASTITSPESVHVGPAASRLAAFIRRGDELGYKAVRWAHDPTEQYLIGYYRNLKAAAKARYVAKTYVQMPDIRYASGWGKSKPRVRPAQGVSPGKANNPARTERD